MPMLKQLSFQRLFAKSVRQCFGRGTFDPVHNESAVFFATRALAWDPPAGRKRKKDGPNSPEPVAGKPDRAPELLFLHPPNEVGVKEKLMRILAAAEAPLTADQVWQQAQAAGLRSKHFTKLMLQEMKQSKRIKTIPGATKGVSFTYTISEPNPSQQTAA